MMKHMAAKKDYSAEQIIGFFSGKDSAWWEKEGQKRALALFHDAAVRVPAYKDFLKKHKIDHAKIQTWEDFQSVPLTSKKDYLRRYPLEQLCWDGKLNRPLVFTATSGSTGEPFYFPRTERLDWQMSVTVESFLKNNKQKINGPILVIDGFGMGVWIGGLITYKGFEMAAARGGYPISIITPGINKEEIFKALQRIAPHYTQVIIGGYAPFVKDIIDEAPGRGIDLKKLNVRFIFAAELFGEKFREYIADKAGVENMYVDNLHIYGTADIGTMAWETPTSILMKRTALRDEKLFEQVFGVIKRPPTFAQYNPREHMFEQREGELLVTGNNAMPLIRYALGDNGGVMTYKDAVKKMTDGGIDIEKEAKKAGVKMLYELPLVYVYERNDLSTTIYGLQIYPETVREALLEKSLHPHVTGKFSMLTKFDDAQNQYLEIHVELKKNKVEKADLREIVTKEITRFLKDRNSEFKHLSAHLGDRAVPKVVLWPKEHPTHFKPGGKQKWIQK